MEVRAGSFLADQETLIKGITAKIQVPEVCLRAEKIDSCLDCPVAMAVIASRRRLDDYGEIDLTGQVQKTHCLNRAVITLPSRVRQSAW